MPEMIEGETTIQTPQCPPECATVIVTDDNHDETCTWYLPDLGYAWCTTCHRRRRVLEQSTEGDYDGRGEYSVRVTRLECGHSEEGARTVIGPAPGGEAAAEAAEQRRTQQRVDRAARWNEE